MEKQLYIRKGNSKDTQDIIIIGEEQEMGSRDLSGYKPSKGSIFKPIIKIDKFSGNKNLTYVHATNNINLDVPGYVRDYNVHEFIKSKCTDLVKWDGETNEGRVRSREAFISKKSDTQSVCDELYCRIENELHGKVPVHHVFLKGLFKIIWFILLLPFRILLWLFGFYPKKKRKRVTRKRC